MAYRISRRVLSQHVAERLRNDDRTVISELAAYLLDTRRTNEGDLIVRDIESALAESGIVIADVVSAHGLSEQLSAVISSYVSMAAGADEVHLRTQVDETALGGVRVQVPGAEYDGTLRRQLTKLQAMKV